MKAADKVLLNTGILYGRMLLTMGISFYTTRLILNALGSTDFGIFNLIAGIITMLSFLNTAMSSSTQRFLSFYQGKNDIAKQKDVFTNSMLLHILIGIIIVLGLEFSGLFLFNGILNIPIDRIESAKAIYHFMSFTVFFTIASVPFVGSLIAHENMIWVAIVSIVETILKLAIAICLLVVAKDKLIIYGLLTAIISIFTFLMYMFYCLKKYQECTFKKIFNIDNHLFKELTSFAGWNLFGSLCGITKYQGFAVLLNIFHGATINASYGIANQISSQLTFFSSTMLRAVNPQIMKSEGSGDRARMLRLSMMASKFGFFLLAIVAIPCIFEMDSILIFWLKKVPVYTKTFCILILVASLINQLTIGLQSAFQATGMVKVYQIVVGTIVISNLPISYLLLRLGLPLYYPLISFVLVEVFASVFRVFLLKKSVGLSISDFFNRVFIKSVNPLIIICATCYLITALIQNEFRFLITFSVSMTTFVISIYFMGLCKDETLLVKQTAMKLKAKFEEIRTPQTLNVQ